MKSFQVNLILVHVSPIKPLTHMKLKSNFIFSNNKEKKKGAWYTKKLGYDIKYRSN
jgi:hypothetical protein